MIIRAYHICLLLACLVLPDRIIGQVRPELPPASRSEKQLPGQPDSTASAVFLTPDTFYDPPQTLTDTLDFLFHQYDPARLTTEPYATLGNLGSAARSLWFDLPMSKGIHTGHYAFDLYKSHFEEFRFYDTPVALTRIKYAQAVNQNDGTMRAQFGRNFADGLNLSLNYARINQLGRYAMQRAKNTAFGIGILYRSPDGKLDGLYQYQSNSIIHEDNGGIDDISLLDSFALRSNIPVRLNGAMTTHRSRILTIQHHVHLFSASGGEAHSRADLDVIHTGRIGSGFVRFHDNTIDGDESAYYGAFVTDDRGIRNAIYTNTLDNALDLQFRYHSHDKDIPAHLLRTGIQYRRTGLDQEPLESTVHEIFFNAAGRLGISRMISIDGRGYLGILDAAGEYRLDATARLRLFKDAQTHAQLILYQRNPNLTERRVFINQSPVWSNDFSNIALSGVRLSYLHPSFRLRIVSAASVVSGLIFFDENRLPRQAENTVEILQLAVEKEVMLGGHLGIRGHVALQHFDLREIAVPRVSVLGQVYYTGRWFRQNLLVRTGFDLRTTTTYQGVSYFPVTGQFYTGESTMIPQYPAVDAFFSMQVKDVFMAFAKVENVSAFMRDDHFVQIADYPQFEGYFRFGLWIKLFD